MRMRRPCARITSIAVCAKFFGAGRLPKTYVDGRCSGVEEFEQGGWQWSFVLQDPRAGLRDGDLRWRTIRCEHGVSSEPWREGEHVIAHVIDFRQAVGDAERIERSPNRSFITSMFRSQRNVVVSDAGRVRVAADIPSGR